MLNLTKPIDVDLVSDQKLASLGQHLLISGISIKNSCVVSKSSGEHLYFMLKKFHFYPMAMKLILLLKCQITKL